MKLESVKFAATIHVPGVMAAAEFDSKHVALTYDAETDMVAIGADGYEVPRHQVVSWKRDRSKEPPQAKVKCECGREFNNALALAGHRGRSGHGKAKVA